MLHVQWTFFINIFFPPAFGYIRKLKTSIKRWVCMVHILIFIRSQR